MSANSSIEWTDRTWNPVRGCAIVSPGCIHCYAMKQAHRFSGPGRAYEGLTKQTSAGPQWTGKVRLVKDALLEPLKWKKPQRVFVNSMSDLFHKDVPNWFITEVFATMALAPRHTFQILTKRPERMRDVVGGKGFQADVAVAVFNRFSRLRDSDVQSRKAVKTWPLPNVWLLVSCEDQPRADERIPDLLLTTAAVRGVSLEPLIGPIDFSSPVLQADSDGYIDWVIVGGESGAGARPCDAAWIRSIVQQCQAAQVACFVKQLGSRPLVSPEEYRELTGLTPNLRNRESWHRDLEKPYLHPLDRKGGDVNEWPADLRVREFPTVEAPK